MSVFRAPMRDPFGPVMRGPFEGFGTDLRAAVIAALFGDGEQGALYEREADTSPATLDDLSGNEITATWNGDLYEATFPNLGANATIMYVADNDGITKAVDQTINGATTLPESGWLAMLVYESALTAEQEAIVRDWLWKEFDSSVLGQALLANGVALNTTDSGLLTVR